MDSLVVLTWDYIWYLTYTRVVDTVCLVGLCLPSLPLCPAPHLPSRAPLGDLTDEIKRHLHFDVICILDDLCSVFVSNFQRTKINFTSTGTNLQVYGIFDIHFP